MRILFIGDVFGEAGRDIIVDRLFRIRHEEKIDFCIANCENASHGRGLSRRNADELLESGVDFITMGNHTFSNNDIYEYINDYPIVRPCNLSRTLPGKGVAAVEHKGLRIGIINIEGRVFIEPAGNDPFEAADNALKELSEKYGQCDIIVTDFHAETTSEKKALALYLDGRVSAVIGTHTHVQTADEQVLKKGTAFITDAGMTGISQGESVIGMDSRLVTEKFIKGVPVRFEPAVKGEVELDGVIMDFEEKKEEGLLKIREFRRVKYDFGGVGK